MFKVRIKEAARAKGVKNYYQLGVRLALQGRREPKFEMMAKRLWEGGHEPTLTTLGLVCDALDCELSDLVVRVNGKRKK
jgi:hypothetical protein